MNTKILILGTNGMLGQALVRYFSTYDNSEVITAARKNANFEFDFIDDNALRECFVAAEPDVVINASAIINLKACEENHGMAYAVNSRLPGIIAECCARYNCYNVQISTDHYYSGDGRKKHTENDKIINPNEYSRSKYIGEQLSLLYDNTLVVRTNIVGFKNGQQLSFLEWCIDSLKREVHMNLFDDFFTSSMFTEELAKVLGDVLKIRPKGIVNIASSTVSSKEEFILALSKKMYNKLPTYETVHANDLLDVQRGNSLGLDVCKIENILGYNMPDLEQVIYDITHQYERSNENAV